MDGAQKSRCWFFTNHNENWDPKEVYTNSEGRIVWMVCQKEKGKENDKIHWQGCCELKNAYGLEGCKKILKDNGIHLEKTKKKDAAIRYCQKDESFIGERMSLGQPPTGQGHRSDLDEIVENIHKGMSLKDIKIAHPSAAIRMSRGIENYYHTVHSEDKERDFKTEVISIIGPSDVGKSRKAKEIVGEEAYWKDECKGWWDNYNGSDKIVIDDFKGDISLSHLLKIMDRYPMRVEVKCGYINFAPKLIVITSIKPIWEYYERTRNYDEDVRKQIERRITSTINFYGAQSTENISGQGNTSACPDDEICKMRNLLKF